MTTPFFCLLTHESTVSIKGTDSKKFLQGQFTCNLNYLTPEKASLSACCTPKGRMISSFRIIEREANHYILALDKKLFDKQINGLKKYAIFSKINFELADNQWTRLGVSATPEKIPFLNVTIPQEINQVTQTDDLIFTKISDHCYELWVKNNQAQQIKEALAHQLTEHPLNSWLLEQIRAGIGQVFLETTERFVPQMINLQSTGGVSFKKGCYIGQEIIARMQYLGKLKQRLYRFIVSSDHLPNKGAELYSAVHSTSVGDVVLAAKTEDNKIELLAVVRNDAAIADLWLKDDQNQLLELLPLPYEINPEEEIKF